MKSARIFRGVVVCLAALGICLSGVAIAAPPTPAPAVHDVALMSGGLLAGQLMDAQGVPKAGVDVGLLLEQRPLGASKTDAQGNFAFQGVRGGVYQLTAVGQPKSYRMWAPGTAPKGTATKALMTTGDTIVRGQGDGYYYQYQHSHSHLGRAKFLLCNPWVVSGIVATAIAVPVGIHNANSGDTPASP